jgi:hypothetical protein
MSVRDKFEVPTDESVRDDEAHLRYIFTDGIQTVTPKLEWLSRWRRMLQSAAGSNT